MNDENQKSASEEFEEFRNQANEEYVEQQRNNLADLKDAGDGLSESERRYSQALSDFTNGECVGVVKFDKDSN